MLAKMREMRMLAIHEYRNRTNTTHSRTTYYMRHAGLKPPSAVGKPISDHHGLFLNDGPRGDELEIQDIDLNIYLNAKKHFCDRFDITTKTDPENKPQVPKLVIRRGFPFQITFRLSRPYKKGIDKVSIQLAIGDRPKIPKKTLIRLPVEGTGKSKEWNVSMKQANANELTVDITPPADCFVGIWRLSGHVTSSSNATRASKFKEVYILFNPFNKEDDVYMADSKERDEYVLNEYGLVFIGTCESYGYKPWSFSQFYGHVLNCTLYLLERSDLPYTDRGKAVLVSRRLAAMVNGADDGGVLEGRWDGEYSGGVPPMNWQGSAKILEQYYKTKKTVQYGQCWVFSGVMCTVCRAIGIPCRSVTNYCSAHDTDSSVSVDHFYNEKKEYEENMNEDSIWNFHVWDEVYMKRPDLPQEEYSGWQAIDATPQETSDGFYSCGPCPLAAIKKGDTTASYDAPFIIAEVNADLIMWMKQKNGSYKYVNRATDEIGKRILTKKIYDMEVQDITLEYKFAEGTAEERASINRAMMSGSRAKDLKLNGPEDVKSEFVIDVETALGADFSMKLKIENTSSENRTLSGSMAVMSTYYTGVLGHTLSKQDLKFVLKPKAKTATSTLVRYTEYEHKLLDHCNLAVRCVMEVDESKQIIHLTKAFSLKKPELKIFAPPRATQGVMLYLKAHFKNPLPIPLTKCVLFVDGSGLTPYLSLPQKNVAVGATFMGSFNIKPWASGERSLAVCFSCQEIWGITGDHRLVIVKS